MMRPKSSREQLGLKILKRACLWPFALPLILIGLGLVMASLLGNSEAAQEGTVDGVSRSSGFELQVPFANGSLRGYICVECVTPTPLVPISVPATPGPTAVPTIAQPVPSFDIPSSAVAILEAPCGALVYGKAEDAELPPASLTKIVTALTAIDLVNLDDHVEVKMSGKELKRQTRSSIMGLEPGMVVTVRDLLYGLFLPSGNDAAIVLAEHVSGSVDAFVALMNQKAPALGLRHSHFANPHGLDSPYLYSSASDMARAGLALMNNPVLAEISGTAKYSLDEGLSFGNSNRLLATYSGAYGVKIGFTNQAKHTIVGAAHRDGRDLYIAVLGSQNLYPETEALLDWAFASTTKAC